MSTAPQLPRLTAQETARVRHAVDTHWRSVGRLLRHLGVPDAEVEDALQQAYLVLVQKLDQVSPGKERAFLASTATHLAARARRKAGRSREVPSPELDEVGPSGGATPERAAEIRRLLARFDAALETMSDRVREVVVLYEVEGLTLTEIAEIQDTSKATVTSRLRIGREQFKERMRDG